MTFPLVQELAAQGFPVRLTCGVLGFSAQAFYNWRTRPVCERDWSDAHLTNAIIDIHGDNPEFGYRFIADELARAGHQASENRVQRLCQTQRIWSSTTRKGRRSSGKTPGPAVHNDLVQRDFSAPLRTWCGRLGYTGHRSIQRLTDLAEWILGAGGAAGPGP